MFSPVSICLFVWWVVDLVDCQHDNVWMNSQETRRSKGTLVKKWSIKFWLKSEKGARSIRSVFLMPVRGPVQIITASSNPHVIYSRTVELQLHSPDIGRMNAPALHWLQTPVNGSPHRPTIITCVFWESNSLMSADCCSGPSRHVPWTPSGSSRKNGGEPDKVRFWFR